MQYRSLGRTGVQVSELCLGTMMFGYQTDEADAISIIDHAIDTGINFVDTANVYPWPTPVPAQGRSEKIVGKALKRDGRRARMVLATKVHFPMDDEDPNAQGNSRRHIIEQCEASLRRLQTDWIDLYQIHRPMSDIPIDETLRALDDLIRAGKVRYVGTSTFPAWRVVEALWVSRELGLNRFISEQPPYHILDRRIEQELVPVAQTYGLALLTWSPLAGGFLTGKYRRGQTRPAEGRHATHFELSERHFADAAFDAVEAVQALAKDKGCTPSRFALAWCASQPGITCPILGPRTMEQFEDYLSALDVQITDEDRARVDAIVPPGRVVVPYYGPEAGADFGPARYRW